jgi:hypothetical protein
MFNSHVPQQVTAFGDVAFTEAIKEGIRVDLKTPI